MQKDCFAKVTISSQRTTNNPLRSNFYLKISSLPFFFIILYTKIIPLYEFLQ